MKLTPDQEAEAKPVLDALLDMESGGAAMAYDGERVTGTPTSKLAAPLPRGVHLEVIGALRCPPIGVSPYAHFKWMLDNANTVEQVDGILAAAKRLLSRLKNPVKLIDIEDGVERDDTRSLLLQGARSGDEINELILTNYVEYDSDTVDVLEGLKPGTTRRVRKDNFCDELGHRKGVPPWAYREFEILDALSGRDAVMDRFQIAPSTYYDVRAKIKAERDAA